MYLCYGSAVCQGLLAYFSNAFGDGYFADRICFAAFQYVFGCRRVGKRRLNNKVVRRVGDGTCTDSTAAYYQGIVGYGGAVFFFPDNKAA